MQIAEYDYVIMPGSDFQYAVEGVVIRILGVRFAL